MRKKLMISIVRFALATVLVGGLAACGNNVSNNESTSEKETTVISETTSTEELDFDRKAMSEAYIDILENIYTNHKLPDGSEMDFFEGSDISENKFAVYDIDQDGKDELIIEYSTASMAGMVELIYGFDSNTNTVIEEFVEFPYLEFFDNGTIKAGWSHNQGLAGDFWPFTLYQYDEKEDRYNSVGMVDAWDKSFWETDYEGNYFPEDSDIDGDGIVYYMMLDGEYERNKAVNIEEYKQWYNSYVGDAKTVEIPFVRLTQENIQGIK